jgi:hypothetical protein
MYVCNTDHSDIPAATLHQFSRALRRPFEAGTSLTAAAITRAPRRLGSHCISIPSPRKKNKPNHCHKLNVPNDHHPRTPRSAVSHNHPPWSNHKNHELTQLSPQPDLHNNIFPLRYSPWKRFQYVPTYSNPPCSLPSSPANKTPSDTTTPIQIWKRVYASEPNPDPRTAGCETIRLYLRFKSGIRAFPELNAYRRPEFKNGFKSLLAISRCPGGAEEHEYLCAVEQLVIEVAIRMLGPPPQRGEGESVRLFWERVMAYKACRDELERELTEPVALGLAWGMLNVAKATAWKLRLPEAEPEDEEMNCEQWFRKMKTEVQGCIERDEQQQKSE